MGDAIVQEQGKSLDELGLRFSVLVRQGFWVGRHQLSTPRLHTINAAINTWKRLAPFHLQSKRGRGNVIWRHSPMHLWQQWLQFQTVFCGICEEAGVCRN